MSGLSYNGVMRGRVCLLAIGVLAAGLVLAVRGPAVAKDLLPQVINVGEAFRAEDLPADADGSTWLALLVHGERSRLVPLKVRLFRHQHDSGLATLAVVVKEHFPPVFLVRGLPELRPGDIRTDFVGEQPLDGTAGVASTGNGHRWRLHVEGRTVADPESGWPALTDGRLVLTQDGQRQVLTDMAAKGDLRVGTWKLFWAGDLDGDRRPDFYMELTHHYATSERTLFLSSKARRGELVRPVATFSLTGC